MHGLRSALKNCHSHQPKRWQGGQGIEDRGGGGGGKGIKERKKGKDSMIKTRVEQQVKQM